MKFQYNALNVNSTRAVYLVGKPTYAVIKELDSIALSAASGLGGGVQGMVAAVMIDQGIRIGLNILQSYIENPASFSRSLGSKYMSDGMNALNANYRLYKKGLHNLSEQDTVNFRNNQILVNLLGEAK